MRYSLQQFLIVFTFINVVIAFFACGNHLFGVGAGITFGLITAGCLFIVWREFRAQQRFRIPRRIIAILFACVVLLILAFPAKFNPDLNDLIGGHQVERATRSQLQNVFYGDPRFSRLDFQCQFTKCIVVRVKGNINTRSDLLDLRTKIFSSCPHISSRWLYWELTIDDTAVRINDCDLTIFGDPAGNSG